VHSSKLIIFLGLVVACSQSDAAELPRRDGVHEETYPGIEVEYGALAVGVGVRLRTILTRPEGIERPPVILFVQWLSCDTVEIRSDRDNGWLQMMRGMVQDSGWAVMRTDKRGVGDSEGGPCSALDYETEVADHRAALAALSERSDIDTQRIVVFGASMGSRMASQVAAGASGIAGVLCWGGGSKTWFERMLAFSRNSMEAGESDPAGIATRMKQHQALYTQYLLEGLDPPAIIEADPAMGEVWSDIIGTSADAHYGRAFAFHQQAQRADWTAAWGRIDVPVLVVMGEYDWFENRAGHETVARIVNRRRKGLGRFEIIPQMDHHFTLFPDVGAAFHDEGGRADAKPFLQIALPWLEQLE
jgi:pimeloyl-ACP methyl ester carboxylesterase